MMSCREVCKHAQDFGTGGGGRKLRMRIRLHLAFCRNCTAFVDQTKKTAQLVRQGLIRDKNAEVDPELMAAFRKKVKENAAGSRPQSNASDGTLTGEE